MKFSTPYARSNRTTKVILEAAAITADATILAEGIEVVDVVRGAEVVAEEGVRARFSDVDYE